MTNDILNKMINQLFILTLSKIDSHSLKTKISVKFNENLENMMFILNKKRHEEAEAVLN